MTAPVIIDENASIKVHAVRTAYRADETPVNRETTTNTFKGTRNNADNWKLLMSSTFTRLYKDLTVALCSFVMRKPRSVPCTG